jgi:hypothetical protein
VPVNVMAVAKAHVLQVAKDIKGNITLTNDIGAVMLRCHYMKVSSFDK